MDMIYDDESLSRYVKYQAISICSSKVVEKTREFITNLLKTYGFLTKENGVLCDCGECAVCAAQIIYDITFQDEKPW